MLRKMNDFFKEISINEPQNYVLFRKLYNNPSLVFTSTVDDISKNNYYDYHLTHNLLLSNSFLKFLDIILYDNDYVDKKTDYYILIAIQCIIYDSEYFCDDMLKKSEYRYCLRNIQDFSLSTSFKNSLHLYESEYNSRKSEFDLALSSKVRTKLLEIVNQKYMEEVRPIDERTKLYSRILCDDYDNPDTCAICLYDFEDSKILNALVCDDYFLEVIESVFLNKELEEVVIDRLIKILELSVHIYSKRNLSLDRYLSYSYIIKKEKIEKYNITKAKELLSKLKDIIKNGKYVKTNILYISDFQ